MNEEKSKGFSDKQNHNNVMNSKNEFHQYKYKESKRGYNNYRGRGSQMKRSDNFRQNYYYIEKRILN